MCALPIEILHAAHELRVRLRLLRVVTLRTCLARAVVHRILRLAPHRIVVLPLNVVFADLRAAYEVTILDQLDRQIARLMVLLEVGNFLLLLRR